MKKNKLLWLAGALCIGAVLMLYSGKGWGEVISTFTYNAEDNTWSYVDVEIPEFEWNGCPPEPTDEYGWNGILPFFALYVYDGPEDKSPTEAQLQAGKGLGTIQWSKKTGGPRHIRGDLTSPSQEDHEVIAWRFLEEKKVLFGINDPHEDLRIKNLIRDKYATTIHFQQMHGEIPIDAYLVVSIFPNGVIHAVSGEYYPNVEIDTEIKVSAQEAVNIVKQHWMKYDFYHTSVMKEYIVQNQNMYPASNAQLKIVLTARRNYLLWRYNMVNWCFSVDAHSGIIRESDPEKLNFIDGGLCSPARPKGNIEVTAKSLDFGIVSPGDHPTKEVVISNTEESILVIRDIVLQGESFSIEEPYLSLPRPVPAGGEVVVSIGFSPSHTGRVTGILSIESTNPVVEIPLMGGNAPAQAAGYERVNYLHYYSLLPYGGLWPSPFFYQASGVSSNQDFFSPGQNYCFRPSFYSLMESPPFIYQPSNNFFTYSFYPWFEPYNKFFYDLF